jgi:hypothetical protein
VTFDILLLCNSSACAPLSFCLPIYNKRTMSLRIVGRFKWGEICEKQLAEYDIITCLTTALPFTTLDKTSSSHLPGILGQKSLSKLLVPNHSHQSLLESFIHSCFTYLFIASRVLVQGHMPRNRGGQHWCSPELLEAGL